jgi:hypothetical protein
MNSATAALSAWIEKEIAQVEAKLSANPPMCTLDRQGSTPPGLKELEGRYALPRRARRLLEAGESFASLDLEVRKAEQLAKASRNASPQWVGYARGAAGAVADIRQQTSLPADVRDASGTN